MNRAKDAHLIINPTDLNQAYVKVAIAGAFVLWVGVNDGFTGYWTINPSPLVTLIYCYVIYAALSFWFAKFLLSKSVRRRQSVQILRYAGMLGDLTACGGAIYFASSYGLVLYPIFITVVIGYGFRFGLKFLVLGVFVGILILVWLAHWDLFLFHNPLISITFLLGMLLIPAYAAFLLAKYQDLLHELDELNQARNRFIANMSHELRTPLNSIILNVESLRENLSSDKPINFNFRPIEIISESSAYLKRLVNRVLEVSSIEAGLFSLGKPDNFDLFKVLSSSFEISATEARKKGVHLSLHVNSQVPQFIVGWQQQLIEILINVIGNAAKFTRDGAINVTVTAENDGKSDKGNLEVSVIDSGIGMTESQVSRVFEPFVLGDDSRTRSFEGTGIGLTLSKQYIDAMGGSIEIRSEYESGTEVKISIPYVHGSEIKTNIQAQLNALWVTGDQVKPLPHSQDNITQISLSDYNDNDADNTIFNCIFIDSSISAYFSNKASCGELRSSLPLILIADLNYDSVDELQAFRFHVRDLSQKSRRAIASLCSVDERQKRVEAPSQHLKILLVDDNEINLESTSLILSNAGYATTMCLDGNAAIKRLEKNTYDLLIMDMHMPDFSGIDIIDRAQKASSQPLPPIIMLTADITPNAEKDAIAAGVAAFLTKPISPVELRKVVSELVTPGHDMPNPNTDSRLLNARKPQYEDIDDLLQNGATKEQAAEILNKFSVDFDEVLLNCCIAAVAGDHQNVKTLTHKLLGSATAMHFDSLAVMLRENESEDGLEAADLFLANLESYKNESERLTHELKSYIFRKN